MPSPKTLIAVAVPWVLSLVAVFWFGQKSARRVVVEREVIVEKDAPAPAEIPVEEPASVGVSAIPAAEPFAVVAEAEEHLRAGLLSQRAVLKAFGAMQGLDEKGVHDAVAEIEAMDPGTPNHGLLMLAVLGRWAEFDGASAMRYAEERLEGDLRSGVITNVVSSWADSDPVAALAWYRQRQGDGELAASLGGGAKSLLAQVFQGLARTDAEAALSELGQLGDGEEFQFALGGMVSAMAAAGQSERLMAHVGRLPDGRRGAARRELVAQWAQFAPADAARWVGRKPASSERASMARDVALAWVRRDPSAAMPWLFAHTPETNQPEALASAIGVWARADPNAAATWLGASAPECVNTDPAIASLARQIVHRDAVSAMAWASTVKEPRLRAGAEASVMSQWAIREPAAALRYVDEADLSDAQRERFRAMLP